MTRPTTWPAAVLPGHPPRGGLTRYRWPQLSVARVTGRRAIKGGGLWGLVFGLYVYDNAFAFDSIAKTAAERNRLLGTMASNAGLKALLGDAHQITTRGGFTDWRAIGITALVASIWGLLAATRALRGEEGPAGGNCSWPARPPRAGPPPARWPGWARACWPCT